MKLDTQKILLGRSATDVATLQKMLRDAGAEVCCIPLIEVHFIPAAEWQPLPNHVDIVVITSQHAVSSYVEMRSALNAHFLAAVGNKTAMSLLEKKINPDITGDGAGAMALLEHLIETVDLAGKHILYPCSNLSKKEFAQRAEKLGATVHMMPVYQNKKPATLTAQQLRGFTVAVFYSSSGAINFYSVATASQVERLTAIAIGKSTARTLAQLGISRVFTANRPDSDALLQAIYQYQTKDKMEQNNDVSHCPA